MVDMNLLNILLISVGLAMDCFAVSIGLGTSKLSGVDLKKRFALGLRVGLLFGLFQGAMVVLGWISGTQFKDLVSDYDHWIVFLILAIVGIKMIHGARKEQNRELCSKPLRKRLLVLLALATSIDALAVGVSFAFLDVKIFQASVLIGLVSFILSFLGVEIGHRLGCYIEKRAELLGGLILIALGLKILIEHLYF